MSEYREMSGRSTEEIEKIDLANLLQDIYQGIRKFWWLLIGLAAVFAALSFFSAKSSYRPQYVATATLSVRVAGSPNYVDIKSTEQMEKVFPYILTSGVLKNVIAEDMGMKYMPGTISIAAEKGTNLFKISATSSDPQVAYDLLQSTIKNYPQVAEFVIGRTTLDIFDESGIPEDTGKEAALKSAVKRGAFKGALFGMLLMARYILTRHTVKSRKELKKELNLEDLGGIPFIPAKKRRKDKFLSSVSLMNERVPQRYMEAIRKVCIRVMNEMEQSGHKSILITSSIPGEGKTTLAVNLAIAAAKSGKRVILIDCDPRNPSVASAMNEKRSFQGLGAVLQGKTEVEDALTAVGFPGGELRVIYGGQANSKDSRLLGTKAMKTLIENLSKKADMVILDTAPSDLLADAPLLAKFVDAACYVVRYDYAKMRQIRSGVQALDMSGVDIIGYLFNADESEQNRGYGYGYRSYGGYGGYGNYRALGHHKADKSGRIMKD